MAVPTINLDATSDKPHASMPREIGKYNAGLYCNKCREFFALAIVKDPPKAVKFASDGKPMFECSECGHRQRRRPSEIHWVLLSKATLRKK
jgi:Zn ribbon nucleic-acid-binding protein